ncbi:glycosyltransferase [Pseudotabrizicola algicola]|uniref:Glycosyltransferase n=1 Tax=Pseudotabrizicola algicola TaxID=2709381 RepID=A0A6B3RIJ8_9RHOB|nr:glycosyltransferase [Pseudotabrizicola algicola]NEX45864.1 glycosyltransferase [Pseudotabrizicola algicola]
MVADAAHHHWLKYWQDPILPFEDVTVERLAQAPVVALAPGATDYLETCKLILDWKRNGLLPRTRLLIVTYKGRKIWSKENDALVERWVVHSRSEFNQIQSDRLAFIPLGLAKAARGNDEGYIFVGGRKMRDFEPALQAVVETGLPCIAISDRLPETHFPGIDARREMVPRREYGTILSHSRIVLVPLVQSPISHGHMDVVSAIRIGKPVVVTAGASCDDYVDHDRSGQLVPENTVSAWVKCVTKAWENAEAYSAAALAKAPEFSAERYVSNVRDLVRSVL